MKFPESHLFVRGCLALALVAGSLTVKQQIANAQQTQERREHVVKPGDTLWDLARAYLSNPFLWPLIYEANRNVVENPHRIYPAERLIIPPLPGEVVAAQPQQQQQELTPAERQGYRTRFYVPTDTFRGPTVITAESPPVRSVEPAEFHAAPWLADTATLEILGEVFKAADPRNTTDKMKHTFHPFDQLHLAYTGPQRPMVGQMLLVVFIGRAVKGYGNLVQPRGVIRVDSLSSSTALAMVTHEFGPLRTGDFVIPMDSFPSALGEPVMVENGAEGLFVDVEFPQPLLGTTDIGFVNLGRAQGINVGDEFVAILPGRKPDLRRTEMIPPQPVARLRVTKVRESTATVRVISLENPALRTGIAVRLVARMPQ